MHRYEPGEWCGVVTSEGVAVLPGELEAGLLDRVLQSLRAGKGLGAVLDALTGTFGTSLSAIPSFAVVIPSGGEARIAVRGPLSVNVSGDDELGSFAVSGARVTTWSESVSTNPESLEIVATEGTASVSGGGPGRRWMSISDGVVLCSRISVSLRAATAIETQPPVAAEIDALTLGEGPQAAEPGQATEAISELPRHYETVDDPSESSASEFDLQPPLAAEIDALTLDVGSQAAEPGQATEAVSELPRHYETVDDPSESSASEFDLLFGDTRHTSVEDAAVRDEEAEPTRPPGPVAGIPIEPSRRTGPIRQPEHPAPVPLSTGSAGVIDGLPSFAGNASPAVDDIDHDHETVSIERVRQLRQGHGTAGPAPSRPGRLELSTGETVLLDRNVIIGRRPKSTRAVADRVPHLLTVQSPNSDISRNHLEIRVEGEHVLAIDPDTTNGTRLLRSGRDPERLHPREATVLVDGDVLDIGDGVTMSYREDR